MKTQETDKQGIKHSDYGIRQETKYSCHGLILFLILCHSGDCVKTP